MRAPRVMILFSNFVEYFNDNVLTMAMACTVGSIGSTLAAYIASETVLQAFLAIVFDQIILLLLRFALLQVWHRGEKDGTVQTVVASMLSAIPWFVRVPKTTLVAAYLQAFYNAVGWTATDPTDGSAAEAFIGNLVVFILNFTVLVVLARVMSQRPDAQSPTCSWTTYLLSCWHLSFMSGSGKSMHYLIRILFMSLEPSAKSQGLGMFMQQVVLFLGAWWMLSSALPNQVHNPNLSASPWTQLHLSCQQYVVVYTWAYSFVNYSWEVIYSDLGSSTSYSLGMALFLLLLLAILMVAVALAASTPDHNFYDMHGNIVKSAVAVMVFWLVDFMTWWAWGQIVNNFDKTAVGAARKEDETVAQEPGILAMNFGILLLLLVAISVIHACNVAALHRKQSTRNFRHVHVEGKTDSHIEFEDKDIQDVMHVGLPDLGASPNSSRHLVIGKQDGSALARPGDRQRAANPSCCGLPFARQIV